MAEKADFGPFLTLIPYNPEIKNFSKIRLEHFFTLIKLQLCAKFQKNLMRGFLDIMLHTDTRTDTRTHNPKSIGLPA